MFPSEENLEAFVEDETSDLSQWLNGPWQIMVQAMDMNWYTGARCRSASPARAAGVAVVIAHPVLMPMITYTIASTSPSCSVSQTCPVLLCRRSQLPQSLLAEAGGIGKKTDQVRCTPTVDIGVHCCYICARVGFVFDSLVVLLEAESHLAGRSRTSA